MSEKLFQSQLILFVLALNSCYSSAIEPPDEKKHMAQTEDRNGMVIYADKINGKAVIRSIDTSKKKSDFSCYKIGFIDSSLLQQEKKQRLKWEKYFDYEMQYNWSALDRGDSVSVTFFQRTPHKSNVVSEAVMVFEVKKSHSPDTLVYISKYKLSDTTVLILKK